jgi:hypothetical protein
LPLATLIIGAPLAARLDENIGTKLTVAAGLGLVATGLWLLAQIQPDDGYTLIGWSLAIIGFGMGTALAPATESIMGALPVARAGVGSATNSTVRQLGGALGVAILGSVLASTYRTQISPILGELPEAAADAARDSIGAALSVADELGSVGVDLAQAARTAFVDAMGQAALVAVGVTLVAAVITLLYLPSRATRQHGDREATPPTVGRSGV